jgi:hypothetical protein
MFDSKEGAYQGETTYGKAYLFTWCLILQTFFFLANDDAKS